MPIKEPTGKWRGVFKIKGQRYQKIFTTKAEAKKWEVEEKAKLKSMALTPQGMALEIFFSRYLDQALANFSEKVYKEKCHLLKKVCDVWDKDAPVSSITVDMAATYLETQVKTRSANAANKDRKNLLALWNWGIKRFDFPFNPIIKVDKFRHDRMPQYTPPTEDIQRLLMAANREEKVLLNCYLKTGARRSEIFRITWNDDINFDKREIRLGTRKTRDHSMEYQWMPMNEDLYEDLLWQWHNRKFPQSPYVFVSDSQQHYGKPFKYRQKFMKGLCKKAGIKPFGFHALRRYVASVLADTHKLSSKRIQRILRHKSVHTTERYIQNLNDDMRDDLNLLSEKKAPEVGLEEVKAG